MVCCVVLVNNVGLLGGGKMLEVEVEEGQKGRLNLARKINKSYKEIHTIHLGLYMFCVHIFCNDFSYTNQDNVNVG